MKRLKQGLIFFFILALSSSLFSSITWKSPDKTFKGVSQPLDIRLCASKNYKSGFYRVWGGSDDDYGNSIALDGSGNLYITGFTNTSGTNDHDAFIAKFNSTGNSVMNITWGGIDSDFGRSIALDGSGNIYIMGDTYNISDNYRDVFIAKFNSTGNSVMNITWGGINSDCGYGIALDGSGNIYITGSTKSFGAGTEDAFIAKFNSSGNSVMNITWGGNNNDYGYGIALDGSGNIYITGDTNSFWDLDGDAFIAKYDSSGNSVMNITWSGSDDDWGRDIILDGSGNIYITGYTYSFGVGDLDVFIAKFDNSGNSMKNITWGGSDNEAGIDIALDGSGNIYITGWTDSFGAGTIDTLIVKFDSSGNSVKNYTWGGIDSDFGRSIALDGSGNIYITGYTYSFGTGNSDAFIVKIPSNENGDDDDDDDDVQEEAIPGYDLFLLIGLLGILSVLLVKKRLK